MATLIIPLLMQEPVKIVLGTERKPKGYGRKRRTIDVEETMVYVPILETLQRLLQNETVVSEVCEHTVPVCACYHVYLISRSKEATKVRILTFLETSVMVKRSNATHCSQSVRIHSRFSSTMMT